MFDNIDVQGAVKRALQTEKNAMNFYELGAQRMANPDARRVFELLAREERGHAQQFFGIYQGGDIPSFEVFMDSPADYESSWLSSLAKAIDTDFNEQKALELAKKELKEENKERNRGQIVKKLQELANLFGELKNRAFLDKKNYGKDEDTVENMTRDEVPSKYKKLLDKYRTSLSK